MGRTISAGGGSGADGRLRGEHGLVDVDLLDVGALQHQREQDRAGGEERGARDVGDVEAVDERLPPRRWRARARELVVVRLVASVERIASPSAPPICCDVLRSPEARPASPGAIPLVAIRVTGTNVIPIPIEISMIPGRRSVR